MTKFLYGLRCNTFSIMKIFLVHFWMKNKKRHLDSRRKGRFNLSSGFKGFDINWNVCNTRNNVNLKNYSEEANYLFALINLCFFPLIYGWKEYVMQSSRSVLTIKFSLRTRPWISSELTEYQHSKKIMF